MLHASPINYVKGLRKTVTVENIVLIETQSVSQWG